jgi:hypothetical protein
LQPAVSVGRWIGAPRSIVSVEFWLPVDKSDYQPVTAFAKAPLGNQFTGKKTEDYLKI